MSNTYYIGWDVGAWHCDNNTDSRDAIIILNDKAEIIGNPWRGNLKKLIYDSITSSDFVSKLFNCCEILNIYSDKIEIILAIDAPLGFSDKLSELIAGKYFEKEITDYNANPYLFRATEKFLFEIGMSPLSSINHMIGSQTTKAMHVVAKFTPKIKSCGVWQDENGLLTVIETYPAACRKFDNMPVVDSKKEDIRDAHICATIAKMFDKENEKLEQPPIETSKSEGWIWIPKLENAKFINE